MKIISVYFIFIIFTQQIFSINFLSCENQNCNFLENNCCIGYKCVNSSNSNIIGVCQKLLGEGNCAKEDHSCGLPEEGQTICCPGLNCRWKPNSAPGSTGKCKENDD